MANIPLSLQLRLAINFYSSVVSSSTGRYSTYSIMAMYKYRYISSSFILFFMAFFIFLVMAQRWTYWPSWHASLPLVLLLQYEFQLIYYSNSNYYILPRGL